MRRLMILVLIALVLGIALYAKELEGVRMPDQVTVGSALLKLNGMGVRVKKVAFVSVKVYVAGLFLVTPAADPAQILAADEPRQLIMQFLYKKVEKEKLVEGWAEGFKNNSGAKEAALKPRIEKFDAMWSDMMAGDRAVLTYIPGTGTKVEIKGKEVGLIEGKDFADALFAIWLGPKPPNEDLKKGLLGK
jgi:hypothetical protein